MSVEFSVFIGVLLSAWLLVAFFLECLYDYKGLTSNKDIRLKKRKCEVCSAVYFISVFSEFWRCPLCDSINKGIEAGNRIS